MNDATYEFEDRQYVDPNVGVAEGNAAIDQFNQGQQARNEQIEKETAALGSQVAQSEGGLAGSTDMWRDQYQTAANNSLVADLRAKIQADALSTALSNIGNQMTERYRTAYRNYYRREEDKKRAKEAAAAAAAAASSSSSGSGSSGNDGGTNKNPTDGTKTITVEGYDQNNDNQNNNKVIPVGQASTPSDLKDNYFIKNVQDLRNW